MKIGVIADTHIPQAMPHLPRRVRQVFRGVDIILHAGDICNIETLNELEEITITMAVSGNRDNDQVRKYVESRRVVEFANRKIGMIHGDRGVLGEAWFALRAALLGKSRYENLYSFLTDQFSEVDCIVFGHTHQPYAKMHNGVLLFNPGAVNGGPKTKPSVGMLTVSDKSISGRIIYL